jgi:hypothetical protein
MQQHQAAVVQHQRLLAAQQQHAAQAGAGMPGAGSGGR